MIKKLIIRFYQVITDFVLNNLRGGKIKWVDDKKGGEKN